MTLGNLKSFQHVSGVPGMAYKSFMDEEARDAYFDYQQVIVLDLWAERVKDSGILTVEQPRLKTSLVTMSALIKPSWCPHPNSDLIWNVTAYVVLELDDDGSLHDLAVIHHLFGSGKNEAE